MPDMRFAPPSALRVDTTEGLNPGRVRTHNDRLVLSLLRQRGPLSRMEIGQITGLSPQTVSVIVRALEKDSLCVAGETRKGKVGPPSTPMSLNPDGAFAFGFHIGLRGSRAVLVDFLGRTLDERVITYQEPPIGNLCEWISQCHDEMLEKLPKKLRSRTAGLGIVFSSDFEEAALTKEEPHALPDFEGTLTAATGHEIYVQNDATAAASAEVIFGNATELGDFAYVFIGRKVEIRLVLNHRVYAGGVSTTLQPVDGLEALEGIIASQHTDTGFLWDPTSDWPDLAQRADWVDQLANQISGLVTIVCGVVNVRNVTIEGDIPADVLSDIVERTSQTLADLTKPDQSAWQLRSGRVGRFAKSVGAASASLYARFMDEGVGITGFLDR